MAGNNNELTFINTKRGGRNAVYNGYIYHKKKQDDVTIFWYCAKRDSNKCKGSLKTLITMEGPQETHEHNHVADRREVELGKANATIRQQAGQSQDRPCAIRLNVLNNMPEDSQELLGSGEAVRKMVRRQRNRDYPANVALRDLVIQDDWALTCGDNPQQFLVHDNRDNNERVIVFASPPCLRLLSTSQHWYIDGNFSMAPNDFAQLYIIRGQTGDSAITCAYALLQRKTEQSYITLLEQVCEACVAADLAFPQPAHIHCDFEMAAHQAVRRVLPHAQIVGCFYHLTQSTYRKIQNLGLVNLYRAEEEFRQFTGMLDGTAFLPVQDISDGIEFLRNNTPQGAEELLEYYDRTYVTGERRAENVDGRIVVRVIRPPLFPRAVWNVHQQTREGGARTNNLCESWNSRVKHLVGHEHPTVWKLLDVIRKEDGEERAKLRLVARGEPVRKRVRRATQTLNRRLRNLCDEYARGERDLANFLRAIGHNIRFGVEHPDQ